MKHETKAAATVCAMMCLAVLSAHAGAAESSGNPDRIRPYEANPRYWQYRGKPVLLLGGSKTDHLFLLDNLREHLDEIAAAGGNYVRCTMSQREGPELKPHLRLDNGMFDLTRWNRGYWTRFDQCLKWCRERGIIVQIELWDRFDYSQEQWLGSPWRPANNINYTSEESGLANASPAPAWRNQQPFFHTVPGSPRYEKRLNGVRAFQERFVTKVIAQSIQFDNVLYCIGNESSAPLAWSDYWANRIARQARDAHVNVQVTQMYDACQFEPVVSRPKLYTYIDASKLLGPRRQRWAPKGEELWYRARTLRESMGNLPRPINAVKIITNQDSQQAAYSVRKFWRGLIWGFSAIRFHRKPAGIALTEPARSCISAARKLQSEVELWDVEPRLDLLRDRGEDEAYLGAKAGEKYALYFTDGGSVGLDLEEASGAFHLKWINISSGEWAGEATLAGGGVVTIQAPGKGGWAAAIVKDDIAEPSLRQNGSG